MDFLSEIADDVRKDNLIKLWNKHGRVLIGAAVAIVMVVALSVVWKNYQHSQRNKEADIFLAALESQYINPEKSAEELQKLADSAGAGYRTLARFQLAAYNISKNKTDEAVKLYQQIADDGGSKQMYRQLAVVERAMYDMEQGQYDTVRKNLKPFLKDSNPWRASAREIYALASIELGKTDDAREQLEKTVADEKSPPASQARAKQILALLNRETQTQNQ